MTALEVDLTPIVINDSNNFSKVLAEGKGKILLDTALLIFIHDVSGSGARFIKSWRRVITCSLTCRSVDTVCEYEWFRGLCT